MLFKILAVSAVVWAQANFNGDRMPASSYNYSEITESASDRMPASEGVRSAVMQANATVANHAAGAPQSSLPLKGKAYSAAQRAAIVNEALHLEAAHPSSASKAKDAQ